MIYYHQQAENLDISDMMQALKDIERKYPLATNNRLDDGNHPTMRGKKPIDVLVNPKTGDVHQYIANGIRQAMDWLLHYEIPQNQTRGYRREHSAYGYKHAVERWTENRKGERGYVYVPMLGFIAAATVLGMQHTSDGNPYYKISEATYKRIEATQPNRVYLHSPRSMSAWKKNEAIAAAIAADIAEFTRSRGGYVDNHDLECHFPGWKWLNVNERARVFCAIDKAPGISAGKHAKTPDMLEPRKGFYITTTE
ncbi:hypothetical protein MRQ47_004465 [Salmonella enterica]|nr:hypothetical protein [Salmonella enterica]